VNAVFICEEQQKVGLLAYHLEGLRVPQFGNHWVKATNFSKYTSCDQSSPAVVFLRVVTTSHCNCTL